MNDVYAAVIGFIFLILMVLFVGIALMLFYRFLFKHGKRVLRRKKGEQTKTEEAKLEETCKIDLKPKLLRLPTVIPKKVKVCVMHPERQIEVFGKVSEDGNQINTKIGSFIIPPDYKPIFTWVGRKCYLTYYFDANGNALTVKPDGQTEPKAPDPVFNRTLIDRGLLAKIFRIGFDWSSLITGVFLGTFLMTFMLFIVLPMVGIPIHVGKEAIIIQQQQGSPLLPSPGNFTIPR